MGESGPADATAGTTVEVRDLFFNTPARAKFLKSPATEQTAIVRVVTQLALANPRVHVRLLANGRVLLNAPAGAGLRERVGALYGFGLGGPAPRRVGRGSGGARGRRRRALRRSPGPIATTFTSSSTGGWSGTRS